MHDIVALNKLSADILDACICVHKEIGPGLLESVYEYSLLKELELRNIKAINRVGVELFYKGMSTGKFYEIDILVENEREAVCALSALFPQLLILMVSS